MKIASLLQPKFVKCGMAAATKQEALEELVRFLITQQPGLTEPELLVALADRERLGPFSMGKGVAFPHARTEKVLDFTIVLGTSRAGIDFRAPDGHKVKVTILFVIPKKHSNLYLQALAAFLNVLAIEQNLQRIVDAQTPEEVVSILEALSNRPREAQGVEAMSVPSATLTTPLAKVMETLVTQKADALPVVDGEGQLIGEVSAAAILQFSVREHMLGLASATLGGGVGMEVVLRQHGEHPIESIPGLVSPNGFRTVQEDEPILEMAVRLARSRRGAYVLRGRKLVGSVTASDLLKKLGR